MVLSGPKQLDAMMKEGTLPGLLLLWGEDAPLMAGYKRRLERWAVTAFPDFNRSQYDGRFPLDLEALGDAARSLPMMAPRRFVPSFRWGPGKAPPAGGGAAGGDPFGDDHGQRSAGPEEEGEQRSPGLPALRAAGGGLPFPQAGGLLRGPADGIRRGKSRKLHQ